MSMQDNRLFELAARLGAALEKHKWILATAESCTGGWIGEAITAVPGSSAWYERGFITYSNLAKQEMLGVSQDTLTRHGAVSEPTVMEMVTGALAHSHADLAVAVSGIAGPDGGTADKPVGTVCLGWGDRDSVTTETRFYKGDRFLIRQQTVERALRGLLERWPSG